MNGDYFNILKEIIENKKGNVFDKKYLQSFEKDLDDDMRYLELTSDVVEQIIGTTAKKK